jgi:hypothetical protein
MFAGFQKEILKYQPKTNQGFGRPLKNDGRLVFNNHKGSQSDYLWFMLRTV